MYKLHLILKYLRKRRIAWVSLIAVTLCTTMVLVVISVMGGWLRMFRASFHGLVGDVIVHGESLSGFPHYEQMIQRIEALPEVKAAVPVIETFGLININSQVQRGVRVVGYPIERIGLVNAFPRSLFLQHTQFIERAEDESLKLSREERRALRARAEEASKRPTFDKPLSPDVYRQLLPDARGDVANWPGMIVGSGVIGLRKDRDGKIDRPPWLYQKWVGLTTVAITGEGPSPDLAADKAERRYWIADDSRTKIWQSDTQTVYVPFEILQRDLKMDAQQATRADTGAPETIPARTTELHVGVKPGHDLASVRDKIQAAVTAVLAEHNATPDDFYLDVETWEQSQRVFIEAIEKEVVLVTILFGIISLVAIFLIFCIFYMIVVEKTKDIGIIKSVGATSGGVAGIFLGYGLAIGIVGSALGLLASFLIVRNINFLHTKMGELMGVQMWNPEVYAFDTIPDTMDPRTVTIICVIAVIASVAGALVPALRAARMNPVEALRWE